MKLGLHNLHCRMEIILFRQFPSLTEIQGSKNSHLLKVVEDDNGQQGLNFLWGGVGGSPSRLYAHSYEGFVVVPWIKRWTTKNWQEKPRGLPFGSLDGTATICDCFFHSTWTRKDSWIMAPSPLLVQLAHYFFRHSCLRILDYDRVYLRHSWLNGKQLSWGSHYYFHCSVSTMAKCVCLVRENGLWVQDGHHTWIKNGTAPFHIKWSVPGFHATPSSLSPTSITVLHSCCRFRGNRNSQSQ